MRDGASLHRTEPMLFRFTVGDLVKQGHAVGLCPQAQLPSILESRIVDLEQLSAVVGGPEAGAFEVDPQAMPTVGGNRNCNPVASLAPGNVKRTADAVHGLVKN